MKKIKRPKSGGGKRYLMCVFTTTDEGGGGEGAATDTDSGGASADAAAASPSPSGGEGSGASPDTASWMDALAIPDEQRESYKDLTVDQVREKLAGPVAPEKYDFALPEGIAPEAVDQPTIDSFNTAFSEVAKELGLSQEAAAKIAGFAIKFDIDRAAAAGPAALEQAKQSFTSERTAWEKEVGASKAQEAIAGADRAIAGFVTPGLAKLLEETGLRNSPDVIKSFAAISAVIGEDSIPKHGASPSDTNDRDQKLAEMYPSMKK